MLQDRFLFSLTYTGDMIQQMHELQVELGADVAVNYIWFHGLLSMPYVYRCIPVIYYRTIYAKKLLILDQLNL